MRPQTASIALLASVFLAAQAPHGINPTFMDRSVQASDDFFRFANGGWIKQATIPADMSRWGSFDELREKNRATLREILESAAAAKAPKQGSALQKVGDFFASGMDEAAIEKVGLAPMASIFSRIESIKDTKDLADAFGRLCVDGCTSAFAFYIGQDDKDSAAYIVQLAQDGLGLPDRDYYVLDDAKSKEIRTKYLQHIQNLFHLAGDTAVQAEAASKVIMEMETRLARASMTKVEQRDPKAIYHKMTPAELTKLAPEGHWDTCFNAMGLKPQSVLLVRQPNFFSALSTMMKELPLSQWKTYLRWRRMSGHVGQLPDSFGRESFAFYGQTLNGAKERQARWKRVQATTDEALGDLVGQIYVEQTFSPAAKAKALDMVTNLQASLKGRIEALTWMDANTKKQALTKLAAFQVKIGYPDVWRDYTGLDIQRGEYFSNVLVANRFEFARQLAKLGKPVDRGEWHITPQTVNAYYNPGMNEIVFPAAILQPPFFDPAADEAVNYGGIGMVIGHEMTHGFDDEGRQYDAQGNLRDWWTAADAKAYDIQAKIIEHQYAQYEVLPGLKVNGQLTLGENIADIGGLKISFEALKQAWKKNGKPGLIDGFTPEQRYFLGFAQIWRSLSRDEALRNQVMTDPHSPAICRVNGPLSVMPEFHETFGILEGKPMRLSPKDCAVIW